MLKYLSKVKNNKKLQGVVLLRLDFNTEDEWRLEASLSTIKFLRKRSRAILILSHRGRPDPARIIKGEIIEYDKKLSLRKDARRMSRLLKTKVFFINHFRFKEIKKLLTNYSNGQVAVLENIRFLPGERENSLALARKLSALGDFYVNDAFAVSHRANASVSLIPRFIESYAGLELEEEIKHLSGIMKHPRKPLVMIFGGGKAHSKLPAIQYFRKKADSFLVGGALANTLLKSLGIGVGNSLVDENPGKEASEIALYPNLILPVDHIIYHERILDIGPKTRKLFAKKIKEAKTVVWNGPLGFIEEKSFIKGSLEIARAIAKNKKAFSVVGGGETVMFLKKYGLDKKIKFISTGGGAMMEFLAGRKLPGIEALKSRPLR